MRLLLSTKFLIIAFTLFSSMYTYAQEGKYITKNGTINFEASVEAFEPVKAKHKNVTALLNTANGELASLALVRGFRFKVALMEEHFNENYMESDTYSKATFKGKLKDFSLSILKEESTDFVLEGKLTLHGKTKELKTIGKVSKKGDIIYMTSSFKVRPEEFAITIPKVVSKKISEVILISLDFELKKR